MSFYNTIKKYKNTDFNSFFANIKSEDILNIIQKETLAPEDFLVLLSDKVNPYLEQIAQQSNKLTLQYFGKAIQLYTPMYLSDYCNNKCIYCGFNKDNNIKRKKLSLDEVEKEAKFISSTGLKHILILTGSSREHSPISYIKDCIKILKKYFISICIEIYALTQEEYKDLIKEGIDGLTIYQEVYNEEIYNKVHISGPKKDYQFRLDAPERAANENIRTINIGTLLGLADWKKEVFFTALHAKYLQDKYPETEISISVPRLQPHLGHFKPYCTVTDEEIVQIIIALRIFLPRIGITLSTREKDTLRDNLIPLGITKMSAGSTTAVGGHTIDNETKQFDIADNRNVSEIKQLLLSKGYQPVLKDWMAI